ncbi:MAG TPA: polysaccharide biosynthesis tyrosine autokinase, partial [Phycisphaerae bacterium]|nr:polysaccharide biosynthesis tyrosine autokinase [Phycisphaerae bacterium]
EVMQEVRERVLTLDALVTELDVELLGRKSQYETLQTVRPEDMPITAELQAILQNDPTLFQFEQRLIQAQEMLNQASRRYGPNHRIVRESTAQRDAADQAFRQDQAAKILHYQSRQIEQARRNYLEAQDQQLALREKLMTAKSEQRDMQVKLADYDAKVADQELLQLDYEKKLEQKNMLEAIYRQRQTVQVEVASIATPPERMSSPKLAVWIPAGTLLGLVVSVGLALLLELADKSVRTPRDVIRAHLPVLGTIPTTDDDEVEIERVETACLDAPHSIVAEAFRNLRANLFFSAPAEQQGVILVTSPSGGNGKTTVASNLAISIALSGRRVLLIDSNFRRAALPRVFPNMREEGLSNILIGQGELKDFVTPTSVPGLEVLSAGPLPPNPAELLGSSFLRDVVVDARSRYDQVIFDGPPVLLVSDAMVLAGAVDGVLLVCEYRNTSRGALQRTQANLEAINARIFGAVLNKVQSRAGGYFRRSYREFYEYHEPSEDAPPARPQLATKAAAASAAATLPTSEGPGSFGGSREGSSAPSTAELDWSDATDEAVAMPAVAVAPAEPPLATTIEESDIDVEQSEGFFRDVGEVPAPVAASIPDMRDIEDVDDFRMPTAPADRAEDSPRRTSWEPASPATLEEAFPSESGAAASYFDSESIVEVPDSEDAVSPAQPDQSVDREPWGLETAPPAQEIAPETTYLPDRAEELNPGSSGESARSAAEEIEDEIDLGDDLADLDSEEFRIDDKFNLDDDFEDPDQTDLRR